MAHVTQASSVGNIQWLTLRENRLNRAIRDNNQEVIRLTSLISGITTDIATKEGQIDDCEAKLEKGCDCGETTCQAFNDIRSMMRELEIQVEDLNAEQNRAEQREAELQTENNEYETKLAFIQNKKQASQQWINNANYISRT